MLVTILLAELLQYGCLWNTTSRQSLAAALHELSLQPSRVQWQQEQAVVLYVNRFRKKAGLPPLRVAERLQQAARDHSLNMVRYGFWSQGFRRTDH